MKLTSIILITAAATAFAQQQQAVQQAAPQPAQRVRQQPAQRVQKPRPIPNERMDYEGFLQTAGTVKQTRESRRITEERFIAMAGEPGTVVLDARSADKYALRHIKGAVSLPFTDFTEESLAKVIPAKTTRVLIYCNNNFEGAKVSFADKRASAALNISTFVNLTAYGYTNIYELGPLLDVKTTKLVFQGIEVER